MIPSMENTPSVAILSLIHISKAIRQYFPESEIVAFDKSRETLALATAESVINTAVTVIDENFKGCDYLFLCTPVIYNSAYLSQIKPFLSEKTILTDVGSVKTPIDVYKRQVIFHESGNNRIQAEAFQTCCNIVYHLVSEFDHFLGWCYVFVFVVHYKIPELVQETVYPVDSSVIPLCIQFRRSNEEFIHSQRVASVISYKIVRRYDISFGLTHLDSVLSGNHTLIEELDKRLIKIDHADVTQELRIETVSYTHLDVYKRQVPKQTLFFLFLPPYFFRDLFYKRKFCPLFFLSQLIPDLAGSESTLRA